jgi:hypothetical protein
MNSKTQNYIIKLIENFVKGNKDKTQNLYSMLDKIEVLKNVGAEKVKDEKDKNELYNLLYVLEKEINSRIEQIEQI